MLQEQLLVALTAEILRARLPAVEESLKETYVDGGIASGARREAILEAIREAHTIAVEATKQIA